MLAGETLALADGIDSTFFQAILCSEPIALRVSWTIQETIRTSTKEQFANCLAKVGGTALGLLQALSEEQWQSKE